MDTIEKFKLYLNDNDYNEATIKGYCSHLKSFLQYYKDITPEDIPPDQIRAYFIYLVKDKARSTSTQNNLVNSLKLFFNGMLDKGIDDHYFPRPRRGSQVPVVLNEEEVTEILRQITDLRDKCMIYLVYSAGLKPVEVIYLKPQHIQSLTMRIYISSAKGDKDRYAILSERVWSLIQEYLIIYKPKRWLFESTCGKQYSKRTLQRSFRKAVEKSGIAKPANLTILRNSFVVHLLEKGIDTRYIQKMLGHKSPSSTLRYLKASKRDFEYVKSPLDELEI